MDAAASLPTWLFAWGVPALEPIGCWVGPGFGANDPSKMSASSKSSWRWILLNISVTGFYVPRVSHSCPPPSQETLQDQQVDLAQASMKLLLLPGFQVHEILHVPFKSEVSASLSPVELLLSSPTGLQSQMLWELLFLMPGPRLGRLTSGSELSLLWENICDIIILQFLCRQVVKDLITSRVHPSYHLIVVSSLYHVEYLFW